MNIVMIIGIIFVIVLLFIFICSIIFGMSGKGMEKTLTKMGNAAVKAQANIVSNNEEIMKETADKTARIHKDALKTAAHSIKEGFTENDKKYCKNCGALIENDSKFCKSCGKEV